ncbi:MAG: murein L,D-transpeptidase [Beijerinckiaceae bacterium]|nr:murein L,D-transpeptidase [Beijerinckiaceae bacterium]
MVSRNSAFKQLAVVAFVALTLGGCEEDRYRGSARHHIPIPSATYTLMSEKGMSKDQPILIRSYKKESELEVWKRKATGEYALLKTYPMCRWSGQLGPKIREGDRMAPEGFYAISPAQMNPNSSFYVSFNMGYPNAYDRSYGRTGAHLMVHGACSSAGCYSMTDDQMGEIYALVREAHNGGQKTVQMQALPFRMTPENLAKHRMDPNIAFWKNLKEGADYFDIARDEPQVSVAGGRYVFNRDASGQTLASPSVVEAVQRKRQQDETQVAALVAKGTPAVKLLYDDGDSHASFKRALAANGSDSLNRSAAWGSRDVGVSRPDAISTGPRVVVLDNSGKARATVRAESADYDAVLAAVAAAAEPAKVEASKPEPARPAVASAASQVAKVSPGAAQAAPVAVAQPEAAQPETSAPFYQRALSFVPLIGGGSQPQPAVSAPVASVVPSSPTSILAPLPPRRADGLRTTRLDQPAAAYASQPATR